MKFWEKLRKLTSPLNDPNTSRDTGDRTTVSPKLVSLQARTTSGQRIQKPLPDPAPYTTHPHITNYSSDLVVSGPHTICRCALPTAHEDAFSRRHHASAANGIRFLSPASYPITWEQAAHVFLDALGVDSRVSPGWHMEDEALLRVVFHEDTVRAIQRYHQVWKGVKSYGQLRCVLEDDVYWWGIYNPKDVMLKRIGGGNANGELLTVNGPFYGGGVGFEMGNMKGRSQNPDKRKGMVFQSRRETERMVGDGEEGGFF